MGHETSGEEVIAVFVAMIISLWYTIYSFSELARASEESKSDKTFEERLYIRNGWIRTVGSALIVAITFWFFVKALTEYMSH
jgi:hypothetical protein